MEFGVAVLSWGARKLDDARALRVIVAALVTLHAVSAGLEVLAIARGADVRLWSNIGLRVVVAALFVAFRPRIRPTP